jgi:hypothetical protein
MIRKTLLASAALALATTATYAGPQVNVSKDHRFVSVAPSTGNGKAASLVQFPGPYDFNNFASQYPNGTYFCCYGNTISGPTSFFDAAYGAAVQFTPASDDTIKKLTAAVGYVSGDQSVTLTLYSDAGNTPGVPLASGTGTTSTVFGSCCGAVTVRLHPSYAVTGGTPYWIAVTTTGSNYEAANFSTVDQVNPHWVAGTSDGGTTWSSYQSTLSITAAAK